MGPQLTWQSSGPPTAAADFYVGPQTRARGTRMRTIEEIKTEIKALPHQEYMKLVHWFSERDWAVWDEEMERDSGSGKLDFLIEEALDEKKTGKLREL